ncbi:MAG TPA: heavy metal-associated domain-containing protein [Polyangiales bacterium]|jgi:copper chaperone CopZ|nr:heavy metal-associated domain-containing protein [Polyangiales bacterium]
MEYQTIILDVSGMTCNNCVRHVREALEQVAGVGEVHVDLGAGRATVKHQGATALASLIAAVDDAGYEAKAAD